MNIGDIVRIRPDYEVEKDRGKWYIIKHLDKYRAFVVWYNYYHKDARPFWIEVDRLMNIEEHKGHD